MIEQPEAEVIRREAESICDNASSLNLLAYRTRILAERAHSLVGADLPIIALQNVLSDAIALVGAERGQILIWVDDEGKFDRIESQNTSDHISSLEMKIGDAIAKRVYTNNYPIVNPDLTAFNEIPQTHELNNLKPLSIMVVPLSVETEGHFERIGVIYLDADASKTVFTDTDVWVIKFLASLTALSIRNIRLTGALRLAYLDTVHALVRALEAKDPYTRGHSERVAEYSERVGKRFGLGSARLKILYSAALLHDIGKIGIRENVLNKPSKLTSDEYDHVKKHPEISESIIHGLTFLTEENAILVQHHERFDGKGYPRGLKGDQISLEGAIIQVADAWDAMTSRRIYRKELDVEEALNELSRNSGTQFNPTVVDVFVQMIEATGLVPVDEISNE
jgi:HD-GYP domain-containing protein (c-di-GMP phosphodiesterase class II)